MSSIPTTLSDEGFLSDEMAAVTCAIREKYNLWLLELRALNRLLVGAQYGFTVHEQSAREVVCTALYIRTLVHNQASVLLIERGMLTSARVMARCALEALFNLGACAHEPTRALAFIDADEVNKRRKAKYLADVQDPKVRETAAAFDLQRILADTQQRIAELDAHKMDTRDMAKAAGLEDLYLTAYAFLSGAVHSSARDIDQHWEVDDVGNPLVLINEPIIDGLDEMCLMVGEIMVASSRALAEVFEFDAAECEASLERLQGLWKHSDG